MTIWLASGNVHKQKELAAILAGHSIVIPADAGITDFEPDETGSCFVENALIKAKALYAHAAFSLLPDSEAGPVLADDSGLCVDALDGRPGIFSARYGSADGKKIGAAERNAMLLEEVNAALAGGKAGSKSRSCRFVCAMALLYSPHRFRVVQETLEGELVPDSTAVRGSGGFGYDPVVFLPEFGRTVAELSEEEKNVISHRGKAARAIAKLVEEAERKERRE
ncbi:MAG: non-canonical purine NTP pyrophosphatase [Treponema sp.]|jgi:XTP/dITP diphosphohydrolase|nr:non-canonical purine NTP pyrophosphatase [Treponema sp.]